jgi:hypothetical protein
MNIITKDITELKTSSKKTLDFYNKYKNIDFIQINDIVVDLLGEIIVNINGDLTNNLSKELFKIMRNMEKELNIIKDTFEKSNKDIINNILLKMYEQKSEFTNDIKLVIEKSDSHNLSKIIDKIEKEQIKLLNDIIPKTNTEYYQKYESMLKNFKNEINNSNQLNIIENKYIEMIKSIELSLLNQVNKSEERLLNNMNDVKTINILNSEIQKETNTNLTTYLNRYNNSTFKGQMAENNVEELLCKIYQSSEIIKKTKEYKTGDLILKRINMEPILFEVKDFKVNVPITDIDKFIRDVNETNISGIMLSISSGISNKKNFQIDITKNNKICIYIHNVEYDVDKIRLAVDIIDNLESKLRENTENITITKDIIEQINNDYQTFLLKRDLTLNHIKESTKKTIQYIEEMELKNLNNYLSSKFSFKNSSTLKCSLCNVFIGTNLKSLAVHKRKCKKNKINDNIVFNDIHNEKIKEKLDNEYSEKIIDNIIQDINDLDDDTIDIIYDQIDDYIKSSSEEKTQITDNKTTKKNKSNIKNNKNIII